MLKSKNRFKNWSIPVNIPQKQYKKLEKNDIVVCTRGVHSHKLILGKVIKKYRKMLKIIDLQEPEDRWNVPDINVIKVVTNKYPEHLI